MLRLHHPSGFRGGAKGFLVRYAAMRPMFFVITGTDTGVGKTVLTAWLARHLRARGVAVAALKPVASSNRDDARVLQAALGGALSLDEINPWHFRAPLAPVLAARHAGVKLKLAAVLEQIRAVSRRFEIVLVEGAGGLLSPLGEDFSTRELVAELRAVPIVVCPNRLGAVNQTLLVLSALPRRAAGGAQVVLVSPPRADHVSRTNPQLLAEFIDAAQIHQLPWLREADGGEGAIKNARVRAVLNTLLRLDA